MCICIYTAVCIRVYISYDDSRWLMDISIGEVSIGNE